MVLTNFECWAHGGGAVIGNDGLPVNTRHMDMFNPRLVQQRLNTAAAPNGTSTVSHISSNGYYGFSYVNAAHMPTDSNDMHNNSNNNAALIQNTNNNNTCVPNANDVNGMASLMHNSMDVGVAAEGAAFAAGTTVFGTGLNATQRCKKRYFVSDDDYANCALLNGCDSGVAAAAGLDVCASKRCRYDDDYAAAQYCNDFFSLPSTQIGTQSCLMDTEDAQQLHVEPQQQQSQQQQQPAAAAPPQQQVDVNMMGIAANFSHQTSNTTTRKRNWRSINCDNILLINQNVANQSNKKLINNKQDVRNFSDNAAAATTYNRMDCGAESDSVEHTSGKSSYCGGAEDVRNNEFLRNTTKETASPLDQVKFPAFTNDHHSNANNNVMPRAVVGARQNEDNAGIAALYATTHGGAFYQYTAAIGGSNQTYVEDI